MLARAYWSELEDVTDKYAVSMEILYFFLHVVNRDAFSFGGSGARDKIQDALTIATLNGVIRSSFDARNVRANFDSDAWFQRMLDESIANSNAAEMEYGQLGELFGIDPRRTSALSCLLTNVAAVGHQEDNVLPRLSIASAVMTAYKNSLLPQHVKLVCESL